MLTINEEHELSVETGIWIKKRVEKGRKTAQNRMNYRN